jgi:hypothetical protein
LIASRAVFCAPRKFGGAVREHLLFASNVTSGEKSELFSGVDLSEKENPG